MRREWGAVTFVLTVVVGMIVVPLALFFANQGPGPVAVPNIPITSSPTASGVRTSPTPSPTPTKKPTPTPTRSP
jgi:quinol-cytochrome oxidoreductase complex cytochrome b subunit